MKMTVSAKKNNKEISDEFRRSFEIIVGVLLSVSLASFLMIMVEKISGVSAFIFDITFVTLIYIAIMYAFTFYKLTKKHFLVPRTILVALFSMFPYMVLRTYIEIEKIIPLTSRGLSIYLIILSVSGILWGFWESTLKNNRFEIRNCLYDGRFWVSVVLLIIVVFNLINGGKFLQ